MDAVCCLSVILRQHFTRVIRRTKPKRMARPSWRMVLKQEPQVLLLFQLNTSRSTGICELITILSEPGFSSLVSTFSELLIFYTARGIGNSTDTALFHHLHV